MGWATKLSNNFFINKFSDVFNHIVSKCLHFHPFNGIISWDYDILIFGISCC